MKSKIPAAIAAMAFSGVLMAAGTQTGPGTTGAEIGDADRPTPGAVQEREADRPTAGIVEEHEGELRADLGHAERQLFEAIDEDGDGYVSREELLSWFEQHDRAGDNRLSESEFAAFMQTEELRDDPMVSPEVDRDPVPVRPPAGPEVPHMDEPGTGTPGEPGTIR
jgi:hypothetical protein